MYHLFSEYAEAVPDGETCRSLREVAKSSKVYLIGGSIPERESDKLYNTLTVWSPDGELLQTHRKMHLFDIDIPGKITFRGEIFFSPNNQPFCWCLHGKGFHSLSSQSPMSCLPATLFRHSKLLIAKSAWAFVTTSVSQTWHKYILETSDVNCW